MLVRQTRPSSRNRAKPAYRFNPVSLTVSAREWLGKKGYDRAFGARPLGRVIQEHVKRPMSEEVLFGNLENGGRVTVDVKDGDVLFEYEEPVRPLKSKKGARADPRCRSWPSDCQRRLRAL